MKKIILFILTISLFANCTDELFSIHTGEEGMPLKSLLADVANKCNLTVITADDVAKKRLNNVVSLVNIKKEPLKAFLKDLLATQNCFVDIKNNKIIISYYKTQTYKLDLVSSSRAGSSSLSGGIGGGNSENNGNSGNSENGNSNNNGTTSLTDTYQFDIWDVIQNKLNTILQNYKDGTVPVLEPVIDKNSGLIIVTGNKNQLEAVGNYMRNMKERLMKEVYIDVKILSVTLSKSHQTGIDWQNLSIQAGGSAPLRASNIFGHSSIFNDATFSMNALIKFLATYGNVNSISNPQIVTLNNQKAVIQVGNNVYYKDVSKITKDQNGNVFTEYTISSQFVGVSLDIVPRIGDNGIITLYVYPTISDFVTPPQTDSNRELPPDIKTNTLVSVVKLKNNQTLILGGLIANDKSLQSNGVPILNEIPLVRYLFSYKEQVSSKKEIVFIITPHIINLKTHVTLKDYGFKKIPSLEELNVN